LSTEFHRQLPYEITQCYLLPAITPATYAGTRLIYHKQRSLKMLTKRTKISVDLGVMYTYEKEEEEDIYLAQTMTVTIEH